MAVQWIGGVMACQHQSYHWTLEQSRLASSTARELTTLCSHAWCGQFLTGKQRGWQEQKVFHRKEAIQREQDMFPYKYMESTAGTYQEYETE